MDDTVEFWKVLVTAAPFVAAGIAWLVSLKNRQSSHEVVCSLRYKNIEKRLTDGDTKMDKMDRKLDRLIERELR